MNRCGIPSATFTMAAIFVTPCFLSYRVNPSEKGVYILIKNLLILSKFLPFKIEFCLLKRQKQIETVAALNVYPFT